MLYTIEKTQETIKNTELKFWLKSDEFIGEVNLGKNWYKTDKVDKNGTATYASNTCTKCGGLGYISYYAYIDGGRCFECGGSGRTDHTHTAKAYTEEYAEKLLAKRQLKSLNKIPADNLKTFETFAFNAQGNTYVVLGNAYEIKDELKSKGAKYNDYIGWHFAEDHPEYDTIEITADDFFAQGMLGNYYWDENHMYDSQLKVKEANKALKESKAASESKSEHVGEIGEKIEKNLTLSFYTCWDNYFGYDSVTYLYNFTDELGNVYIWKTSKWLDIQSGDQVSVKGTIKDHSEYKGIKQTVLTRCKVTF